jgi:hypothetical protein
MLGENHHMQLRLEGNSGSPCVSEPGSAGELEQIPKLPTGRSRTQDYQDVTTLTIRE